MTAAHRLPADAAETTGRQAFSVDEFCSAFRISRASFYNLLKAGRGPRTFKVGQRTLVSVAAASEWRSRLEAEADSARVA